MEYVTYILIILGIMALCIVLFRRKDNFDEVCRGSNGFSVSSKPDAPARLMDSKVSSNERLNVPTPWGWPGNNSRTQAAEEVSVSETLQRLVDHVVTEKQTVEDSNYLLKRNQSLRLLVEDRYGLSRMNVNGSGKSDSIKKRADMAGSPIVVDRKSLQEVRTPWGW